MAGQSRSKPYASLSAVDSGQHTPGTGGAALPNKPCQLAKFKARSTNTALISVGKIGLSSGSNVNGGLTLSAREETGWWPITNLNRVGVIGQNASDVVEWVILA